MTTVTPLAVNAISQAYVEMSKNGVDPVDIYTGYDDSEHLSDDKRFLMVRFVLEIPSLPRALHDKFVRSDNPDSHLMAQIYLQADFTNCSFNEQSGELQALDSIDDLDLYAFNDMYFELTNTVAMPKDNQASEIEYYPIPLTVEQQLMIANDVLASIKACSKQQVLNAVLLHLTIMRDIHIEDSVSVQTKQ